jgi:hypothetical protein
MSAPLVLTVLVNGVPVRAELGAEAIEVLRTVLDRPATPVPRRSPYMTAAEAGAYLRPTDAPRGRRRVYELVGDGRLTRCGDGRRLLVRRDEVEALANGSTPSTRASTRSAA